MKRVSFLISLFGLLLGCDAYSQSDTVWIADFEKNPHPNEWQIEGYAFGTRSPGQLPYHAAVAATNLSDAAIEAPNGMIDLIPAPEEKNCRRGFTPRSL